LPSKIKNQKILPELKLRQINELNIYKNFSNYTKIKAFCNRIPLKMKFCNKINSKINLYLSKSNEKPNNHNFDQIIQIFDMKQIYKTSCFEVHPKFFTFQFLYICIESEIDCTLQIIISFGKDSLYVYKNPKIKNIKSVNKSNLNS